MPSAPTMSGFCTPARTTRPNGVLLQQEPEAGDTGDRDRQDQEAVTRVDEVADDDLPAQFRRDRPGQRRCAEDHAQRLLGDHREAEGQQQRQARIGLVEAAEQEALDDDAEQADQHRRDQRRPGEAEVLADRDREVGADRVERAVGEIDDPAEREDQRQPERDEQVVRTREQAVQQVLDEEHVDAGAPGTASKARPARR